MFKFPQLFVYKFVRPYNGSRYKRQLDVKWGYQSDYHFKWVRLGMQNLAYDVKFIMMYMSYSAER